MSVAFSVLVVKLHFKTMETRPPYWVRVFVFKYLARAVCLDYRGRMSRLVMSSRRKPPRRDATWSETATEEIRSQTNSHGTLTPDGPENFELLHQRRRMTSDSAAGLEPAGNSSLASPYHGADSEDGLDKPVLNEWKKMAEVLDRFFFYLFLTFLIVPTATILGLVRLFKPSLEELNA